MVQNCTYTIVKKMNPLHLSEGSLVRRFTYPKVHLSEGLLVRICHECTPLSQRPSAAISYYNPRFAMRVHPPVPASGVLNERTIKIKFSPSIERENG